MKIYYVFITTLIIMNNVHISILSRTRVKNNSSSAHASHMYIYLCDYPECVASMKISCSISGM